MAKIYRVLGKEGRVTIPEEIRTDIGFKYNDILSFQKSGNTVIIRREKVCTNCKSSETKLSDTLDALSLEEQYYALEHLKNKIGK